MHVLELTSLYKAELPNMRLESIHRILQTKETWSIIVQRKGQVIGGCTYIVYEKIIELALLAVGSQWHRCGLGSKLMSAFKSNIA